MGVLVLELLSRSSGAEKVSLCKDWSLLMELQSNLRLVATCAVLEVLGRGMLFTEVSCFLCQAKDSLVGTTFQAKIGCHLCQACDHLMRVTMQVESGCHFCCAWGHLARATGYAEASCYFLGRCGPLRCFGKVCSTN